MLKGIRWFSYLDWESKPEHKWRSLCRAARGETRRHWTHHLTVAAFVSWFLPFHFSKWRDSDHPVTENPQMSAFVLPWLWETVNIQAAAYLCQISSSDTVTDRQTAGVITQQNINPHIPHPSSPPLSIPLMIHRCTSGICQYRYFFVPFLHLNVF